MNFKITVYIKEFPMIAKKSLMKIETDFYPEFGADEEGWPKRRTLGFGTDDKTIGHFPTVVSLLQTISGYTPQIIPVDDERTLVLFQAEEVDVSLYRNSK